MTVKTAVNRAAEGYMVDVDRHDLVELLRQPANDDVVLAHTKIVYVKGVVYQVRPDTIYSAYSTKFLGTVSIDYIRTFMVMYSNLDSKDAASVTYNAMCHRALKELDKQCKLHIHIKYLHDDDYNMRKLIVESFAGVVART